MSTLESFSFYWTIIYTPLCCYYKYLMTIWSKKTKKIFFKSCWFILLYYCSMCFDSLKLYWSLEIKILIQLGLEVTWDELKKKSWLKLNLMILFNSIASFSCNFLFSVVSLLSVPLNRMCFLCIFLTALTYFFYTLHWLVMCRPSQTKAKLGQSWHFIIPYKTSTF